jgi:WD40 repeat protein
MTTGTTRLFVLGMLVATIPARPAGDTGYGRKIVVSAPAKSLRASAVSEDGSLLVTATENGVVRFYDASNGREMGRWQFSSEVEKLRFAAEGTHVVATLKDKSSVVWNLTVALRPVRLRAGQRTPE